MPLFASRAEAASHIQAEWRAYVGLCRLQKQVARLETDLEFCQQVIAEQKAWDRMLAAMTAENNLLRCVCRAAAGLAPR